MSTRDTFILLQPQRLRPSLSKLWHRGELSTLYWRSADGVEMPLRICTSSLHHAAYIFHRRSVSRYLKGDFPAGSHKETSRAVRGEFGPILQPGGSFMSPVRTQMASWATFAGSHWSCCHSSSRTATTAYLHTRLTQRTHIHPFWEEVRRSAGGTGGWWIEWSGIIAWGNPTEARRGWATVRLVICGSLTALNLERNIINSFSLIQSHSTLFLANMMSRDLPPLTVCTGAQRQRSVTFLHKIFLKNKTM